MSGRSAAADAIAADWGCAGPCGRVKEGLSHVDAAVEGATQMGRKSRLPLLLVKCGEIHLLAGESAAATRLATTALALATEQKERGNEVYARHLLGELHAAAQPASAAAQRYYAEALAIAIELGMRPLAAHCHAGLARRHAAAGEPDRAREHLTAAIGLYRAMAMRFWLAQLEREAAGAESPEPVIRS